MMDVGVFAQAMSLPLSFEGCLQAEGIMGK